LQPRARGLLSTFVTLYVVIILALAGQREEEVALARIASTILGGSIALAVQGLDVALGRRRGGAG
jgi:uncharacterized membrane protein YccC